MLSRKKRTCAIAHNQHVCVLFMNPNSMDILIGTGAQTQTNITIVTAYSKHLHNLIYEQQSKKRDDNVRRLIHNLFLNVIFAERFVIIEFKSFGRIFSWRLDILFHSLLSGTYSIFMRHTYSLNSKQQAKHKQKKRKKWAPALICGGNK